jgi:hypothetical protein
MIVGQNFLHEFGHVLSYQFKVKEQLSRNGEIGVPCKPAHTLEFNVFERTKDDDKPGMSHEDKQFHDYPAEFKLLCIRVPV